MSTEKLKEEALFRELKEETNSINYSIAKESCWMAKCTPVPKDIVSKRFLQNLGEKL